MNKKATLMTLFLCLITNVSFAAERRINEWGLGSEIYYFQYKEPAFNVKEDGAMYGVAGSFTHRDPNYWMLEADGHAAWGSVDYRSTTSGSVNSIDDYVLEGRISAGYDFHPKENLSFTPFFGVGYRYLNDDSSGKTSSAGARGYERESNYFYSPVGAELNSDLKNGWTLAISGEYDIFWSGKQESHLNDAIPGLNTVSNDQNDGYGIQGSVKLGKKGERFDIAVEPFIRWWSVKDSQVSNVTYTGVIVGYAYEPKNETLEIGGEVTILF